jgi:tetratricopeptide (TPR) repeat protein
MRLLAPLLILPCLAAPAAADEVEALVAAARTDGEAALRLAHIRSESGDLQGAIALTNQALKADVHPLRVHLVRGEAYLAAEAFADAVREFFEVVVAAPHNGHAHVQLWLALRAAQLPPAIDAQRVREVLRTAGFFVADAPKRPRAPQKAERFEAKGFAHIKAGRFEDAIEAFQSAVVEDDTRPQPFRGLGIAHGRLDREGPSVAAWRLYLALTDREDRERRQVERIILDSERRRGLAGDGKVQ